MINEWIGSLAKPEETFRSARQAATLGKALMNIIIPLVLVGLLVGLIMALVATTLAGTLGLLAIIVAPIVIIVGGIILLAIWNALALLISKFLGGKGSFTQQFYLTTLPIVPALVVIIALYLALLVSIFLMFIPVIGGIIFGLVYGVFIAFATYAGIVGLLAFKEAHQFSFFRVCMATGLSMGVIMAAFLAVLGIIGLATNGVTSPFSAMVPFAG